MNMIPMMRRSLIPIAVGIGLGVFVAAFLGYFIVAKESTYWVDGLGRPLITAPWLARLVFGTDKEWAGWSWFFLDFLWFWGGIGLATFLGLLAGERSAASSPSKPVITVIGIALALGTAYLTQHTIKVGVTLGLEAGLGSKPEAILENAQAGENFPFMTSERWFSLTEHEQEIYVQALLETWSFILYSMFDQQKLSSEFSAFTACAETEKAYKFKRVLVDLSYFLGELDEPVVSHIFDKTHMICKDYINEDNDSWHPIRFVQKQDWEKFNDRERKVYLMGYVDLHFFSLVRILTPQSSAELSNLDRASLHFLDELKRKFQDLKNCLAQYGIEGLFTTMSKQSIEWQHPLPWSAATALGNTCKRFRTASSK